MQVINRGLLYDPRIRWLLALPLVARRRLLTASRGPLQVVLDRLADRVVGDVTLSVPEFDGEFALPATSDLFRRLIAASRYENELRDLFLSAIEPERDVIDVGANVGFFAVLAAKRLRGGRALAIEPGSAAFTRLGRNVAHNGVMGRVILFKGMAGSENGEAVLNVIPGKEEYSSGRPIVHEAAAGLASASETVPVRKLDDLVREFGLSPSIVKIDVEGGEAEVLEGAQDMLRRHRPRIICEFSRALLGPRADRVLEILKDCSYQIVDALHPDVQPGLRDPCDLWCLPL